MSPFLPRFVKGSTRPTWAMRSRTWGMKAAVVPHWMVTFRDLSLFTSDWWCEWAMVLLSVWADFPQ